ncbi:dihydrofolate reductase [Rhodococcoides fascians]|uniref:dihydrofolate reductase n=1 Tax=Rhodococcoides fascians TaxID=1828 RepID=UPI000561DF9A|nr:dihydrofolate reductase [Rhodococcus fascians]
MTPSNVGLIWAQSKTGAIGQAGRIPWEVPEDMAHFRKVTMSHPVIMGRKTWDSLPGRFRPLPGRINIVVTRNASWVAPGAKVASSVQAALDLVNEDTVWVIGGGEIYRAAMRFATELVVTEINVDVDGDTQAPKIDQSWQSSYGDWLTSKSRSRKYRFARYVKSIQAHSDEISNG